MGCSASDASSCVPVLSVTAWSTWFCVVQEAPSRTVFFNGLLHGFSWDGTPTLAPALAFTNWGS
eukprot:41705-Eustigmatos_ZCMA.PRE.1